LLTIDADVLRVLRGPMVGTQRGIVRFAGQELVIDEPANWTLICNNRFELSGGGPTVEIHNQPTVLETIILPLNQSK